jgi:hypothetical protein
MKFLDNFVFGVFVVGFFASIFIGVACLITYLVDIGTPSWVFTILFFSAIIAFFAFIGTCAQEIKRNEKESREKEALHD